MKRRKCGCDNENGGRCVCDVCQKIVGKKIKDKAMLAKGKEKEGK